MDSSSLQTVGLIVLVGALPFVLIATTSYAKISIVLALLRRALGLQQVPSNTVIAAIAIALSGFVMAPVGAEVATRAAAVEVDPSGGDLAGLAEAAGAVLEPVERWLERHGGEQERAVFVALGRELYPEDRWALAAPSSPVVTVPAFVLTELKEAFVIGFLLFVPFLVVDVVVSNVLMSLGMHMLSPTAVSLPFKLLLFVLIDGWTLLVQGLVLGYA